MFRVFFFFKQKTAYEMRISDWSSDVCSSDLYSIPAGGDNPLLRQAGLQPGDVVLSVNGRAVDPARLGELKQALDGQSQATIRYRRGGTTHTATVKAPQCPFIPSAPCSPSPSPSRSRRPCRPRSSPPARVRRRDSTGARPTTA